METINNIADYSGSKFGNRILARTVAFQILYQNDMNPDSNQELINDFLTTELPEHEEIYKFVNNLINGVKEKREEIDAKLCQVAHNWSIERMTSIDRNILRLAAYEIFYMNTPASVVINEAIELAKKFSGKDSASFVNGILDSFGKKKNNEISKN
ncbi:MAG: transcription antitermination factor NusB [Planctomycetaceae bacterium]|jgi:N utilization substance protein B|nr:transcription antitermination factor NusB [Planctomycetaceae bacterium]